MDSHARAFVKIQTWLRSTTGTRQKVEGGRGDAGRREKAPVFKTNLRVSGLRESYASYVLRRVPHRSFFSSSDNSRVIVSSSVSCQCHHVGVSHKHDRRILNSTW